MRKKLKLIVGSICIIAIIAVSMIAAFQIAKTNLEKDFKPTPTPTSPRQTLLTLQYASVKQKEDDVQTTATLYFYDNHECFVEGVIASMYNWSYSSTWSAEGGLSIATAEKVNAECTDEKALAFLQVLKLETKYDMNVKHTVSVSDGAIELIAEGFEVEKGDSLMKLTFAISQEDAKALGIS